MNRLNSSYCDYAYYNLFTSIINLDSRILYLLLSKDLNEWIVINDEWRWKRATTLLFDSEQIPCINIVATVSDLTIRQKCVSSVYISLGGGYIRKGKKLSYGSLAVICCNEVCADNPNYSIISKLTEEGSIFTPQFCLPKLPHLIFFSSAEWRFPCRKPEPLLCQRFEKWSLPIHAVVHPLYLGFSPSGLSFRWRCYSYRPCEWVLKSAS